MPLVSGIVESTGEGVCKRDLYAFDWEVVPMSVFEMYAYTRRDDIVGEALEPSATLKWEILPLRKFCQHQPLLYNSIHISLL